MASILILSVLAKDSGMVMRDGSPADQEAISCPMAAVPWDMDGSDDPPVPVAWSGACPVACCWSFCSWVLEDCLSCFMFASEMRKLTDCALVFSEQTRIFQPGATLGGRAAAACMPA